MATAITKVASSDGVRLAVHELGGHRGQRPLLLAHATGFHARVWGAVADRFDNRWCLAPDFRGYGDSTPPADEVFDWHGFADDVLAVVDHFGLSDVDAIGHSKGGAALLLAELARPGIFERMVCFEPIVVPRIDGLGADPQENPLAASARRRRTTFDSHEDAITRFGAKPPLGSLRPDVLDAYVRHGFRSTADGRITLKADREHEARTYEMGMQLAAFEQLVDVTCPVLIVAGADGDMPGQLAPAIADQLPAGRFRRFETGGHFGPLEDPDGFADVVGEFLVD